MLQLSVGKNVNRLSWNNSEGIGMADVKELNGEIVLSVFGNESLDEIDDALLKHVNETMEGDAPGILVKYPVVNAGIKIGFVTIETTSTERIFEHYTLSGQKLFNEFKVLDFYSGAYGMVEQKEIEKDDYWMVIGYSQMEGEYPVRFNLTESEAKELAKDHPNDKARFQGKKL